MKKRIILASASPRRRELLSPYFRLRIIKTNSDERLKPRELPIAYVKRIAHLKWKLASRTSDQRIPLLAADTIVVLGRKVLGKPKNRDHANKMLRMLSGKTHEVITAVVVGVVSSKPLLRICRTKVSFRDLSSSEIETYLRSGEWKDKAGSYAIQGQALQFTRSIVGSLTSVIGLPLAESLKLIEHSLSHLSAK